MADGVPRGRLSGRYRRAGVATARRSTRAGGVAVSRYEAQELAGAIFGALLIGAGFMLAILIP
jgi:hypothetical protein